MPDGSHVLARLSQSSFLPTLRGHFIEGGRLPNDHAVTTCQPDHLRRSVATGKGDDDVRPTLPQHLLVPGRSGGAPMCMPIGSKGSDGNAAARTTAAAARRGRSSADAGRVSVARISCCRSATDPLPARAGGHFTVRHKPAPSYPAASRSRGLRSMPPAPDL